MIRQYTHTKDRSIMDQVAALRMKYPAFSVDFSYLQLVAEGRLTPTPRSDSYLVKIQLQLDRFPEIFVLDPLLRRNEKNEEIPHMFTQERLCLFKSGYRQYTKSDLLTDTIIPWSSLWLYYYEQWHITGKWLGGGEHPGQHIVHA